MEVVFSVSVWEISNMIRRVVPKISEMVMAANFNNDGLVIGLKRLEVATVPIMFPDLLVLPPAASILMEKNDYLAAGLLTKRQL
jgi:hypothetical protein